MVFHFRPTIDIRSWIVSVVIAGLMFALIQPAFAQIFVQDINLAQFVANNNVEVGSEVADGYHQVFYIYQGKKVFITKGSQNSTVPSSNNEFIAFRKSIRGANQIFLYYIPSGETVQLTHAGNNTNPRLSQGKVVWEGWIEDGWQIFLFDGKAIRQLSNGDVSVNPDIKGDEIVYARKNNKGEWRAVRYSIRDDQAQILKKGIVAKHPRFQGDQVIFELEELLVESTPTLILTLTPSPTPTPEVTPEPDPTLEPTIEPTPTPTPSPTPESTPTPTPEPTEPEPTPEPESTPEPTSEPTATPTSTPTPEVTPESTPTPTATPESTPESTPTPTPTPEPTEPDPVTEEDIIEELEGTPLVEEEIAIDEPAPEPESSTE